MRSLSGYVGRRRFETSLNVGVAAAAHFARRSSFHFGLFDKSAAVAPSPLPARPRVRRSARDTAQSSTPVSAAAAVEESRPARSAAGSDNLRDDGPANLSAADFPRGPLRPATDWSGQRDMTIERRV